MPIARPATLHLRPWMMPGNSLFTCGTCDGLLAILPTAYGVVAVTNSQPGNGDFAALLTQLVELAKRNNRDLLVLEIHNPRLGPHLVKQYGYTLLAGGQHAFLAVAGSGLPPVEFSQRRKRNSLDAIIDKLITL